MSSHSVDDTGYRKHLLSNWKLLLEIGTDNLLLLLQLVSAMPPFHILSKLKYFDGSPMGHDHWRFGLKID